MMPNWQAWAVVLAFAALYAVTLWRLWRDARAKTTVDPETWGQFLAEIGIVRGRWLR